ncbi:MAG: hypothetical protein ACXVID_03330, partial [Thermoanaerobaculia bacterium]
ADRREIGRVLEEELKEGDLLLTMGAGDVNQFGEEFLRREEGKAAGNVVAQPAALAQPTLTPSKKSEPGERT